VASLVIALISVHLAAVVRVHVAAVAAERGLRVIT
jgi:hypothetical protein